MLINNKFIIREQFFLQEKCIKIIEKELSSFFELRLKSAELIVDLFIKGSSKTSKDILYYINISNEEIENFIETIECKLSREIEYTISGQIASVEIDKRIKEFGQDIENNIEEMKNTEQIVNICEKFLDKSLSKIFETYFNGKIINILFEKVNMTEKILGDYSVKKQKVKHGEIICNQIQGFMLNMKNDLRNELVKSTLIMINSLSNYEENLVVA